MAKTRSSAEVWLIGKGTYELSGSHLPSNGDVLRLLMLFHVENKATLKEAAASAVSKVFEIWEKARIPHQRIDSGVRILLKLLDSYEKLKKNRKRSNERDQTNQEEFQGHLLRLFDVSTSDALATMKIEEDKQFLIMQRQDVFSCTMAGVDVVLTKKEARKRARQERMRNFTAKATSDSSDPLGHSSYSTAALAFPFSSSSSSSSSESDVEFTVSSPHLKSEPKRAKINILADPDVAGALDRVNLPDRGATFVLGAVAKALGQDVAAMTLSRSSIRRSRCKNREETAGEKEFDSDVPLLLHWDGKLLPDISGKKVTVDRIAILVTGGGEEMLLGVPKIGRGTGEG
jgi:hypothetical protein